MYLLSEKQIECIAGGEWVNCFCDGGASRQTLGASGCHLSCCWSRGGHSWRAIGLSTGDSFGGVCESVADNIGASVGSNYFEPGFSCGGVI